LDQIETPQIID